MLVIIVSNIVLLSSYKYALFDGEFYTDEFVKNGVYAKYNKTFVDEEHNNIMSYLLVKNKVLESKSLSEQDRMHLQDVEKLMRNIEYYSYFMIISMFIMFGYLHIFHREKKDHIWVKATIITGITDLIIVGLLYLSSLNFEWFFTKFHQLSFNNNLWLMDPAKDLLVNLYPQQFWIDALSKIMMIAVIISVSLIAISLLSRYFMRKYETRAQEMEKNGESLQK